MFTCKFLPGNRYKYNMNRKVKFLTLSSLKRIQRLLKKGFDICVDFYACLKGNPSEELSFQLSSGDSLFVTRSYFDPRAVDDGYMGYEDVEGITLDDIIVDSMTEIYYSSRKW